MGQEVKVILWGADAPDVDDANALTLFAKDPKICDKRDLKAVVRDLDNEASE